MALGTAPKKNGTVNILSLKKFVTTYLPNNSQLRALILQDKEELGVEEFIVKTEVWLNLLELELSTKAY